MKTYHFFYSGPFSQWASSKFKNEDGTSFCTAEQYMMYMKALHFNDHEIAEQILATSNPKIQKQLGRKVRNFDDASWKLVCRDIVFHGNWLKFTQNPSLLATLMNTECDEFVEASPVDKLYGIGLNIANAMKTDPSEWPGENWLGLAITQVRDKYYRDQFNVSDD